MIEPREKIAFCFPGQLQGRPKLEDHQPLKENPLFQEVMEKAFRLTQFDLIDFSLKGETAGEDSLHLKLQIATYLLSMVHFYLLRATGWVPHILAEHSMGIYAALASSEAITFEEGLFITESIGRLLGGAGTLPQGAMASITGLSLQEVQKICQDLDGYDLFIANYNGPMHFVISGEEEGVEKAVSFALARKALSATRLAFRKALHSSSLLSLREEITSILKDVKIEPPKIPILSHWTVKPLRRGEIKDFLSQEVGRPVYWIRCVEKLVQDGVTQFVEVGHESTLTKLIRGINREVEAFSTGDRPSSLPSDGRG
jgi:malonyl CoA-acyl carrier protein transacylase